MNPLLLAVIAGAVVLLLSSFSSGAAKRPPKTKSNNNEDLGFLGGIADNLPDEPAGTDWENLRIAPGGNAFKRYVNPQNTFAASILFGPLGAIPGLIGARARQKEARRVENRIQQMKNQNWSKINLRPEDYITEAGVAKTRAGLQDVLNGTVKAKYLPAMIKKVGRYISREDDKCSQAKSKGAERACRRYYVAARLVKKFLEDELNEVQ